MSNSSRAAHGFTLIEVLVSSAVLGVLMLILLGAVTNSLSTWRVTEARMAADREARSGFQILADDLANAVVPTNTSGPLTNLWPQIRSDGAKIGFLTLKPTEYQNATNDDFGDVCFVEYEVRPQAGTNILTRRFVGSKETFGTISSNPPSMPTNSSALPQLLATNVISNSLALKGTAIVKSSVAADVASVRTNFTALILSNGVYSVTNAANPRPDAIQVSIGAVDLDTVRSPALTNTNVPLRVGGFYTFTVNLPLR